MPALLEHSTGFSFRPQRCPAGPPGTAGPVAPHPADLHRGVPAGGAGLAGAGAAPGEIKYVNNFIDVDESGQPLAIQEINFDDRFKTSIYKIKIGKVLTRMLLKKESYSCQLKK